MKPKSIASLLLIVHKRQLETDEASKWASLSNKFSLCYYRLSGESFGKGVVTIQFDVRKVSSWANSDSFIPLSHLVWSRPHTFQASV